MGVSREMATPLISAFRQGLDAVGFVEGRNVRFEYRYANGEFERLPILASELVQLRVSIIVAGSPSGVAAKAATSTIPIIAIGGSDPVRLGLVGSLNRPGGNVTAVTMLAGDLETKRLGLLQELIPEGTTIAALVDANYGQDAEFKEEALLAAARRVRAPIRIFRINGERDFDPAFAALVDERARALSVTASGLFYNNRDRLVELAARNRVPAIYELREFAAAGGLMSYAPSLTEVFRQSGVYAGRIIKGEKPADLPVLQPTKFELVVNLKTAKALGLTIPETLLATADEVIQ
jgi:putative ABC transport system substrate-binding protein